MNASYRIVELVRKAISSPYVVASDTEVSKAIGISRTAVSAYKHGKDVMSLDTLERAHVLLKLPNEDLLEYSLMLALDASPETKAIHAAHKWMTEHAKNYGALATDGAPKTRAGAPGKIGRRAGKAAALLLAIGAGITGLSVPSPSQASGCDSSNSQYYVKLRIK